MEKSEIDRVTERVIALLRKKGGKVSAAYTDESVSDLIGTLRKGEMRQILVRNHSIVVSFDSEKQVINLISGDRKNLKKASVLPKRQEQETEEEAPFAINRAHHTFIPPPFSDSIKKVLTDVKPMSVWLWGPTGSGKTVFVQWLARELNRKLFRTNCREDMDSATLLGEKTIDFHQSETGNVASVIRFQVGQVIQAMTEGLNEKGEEVGQPAILYVDEAAAISPQIGILLNRLLESDTPQRTIVLETDGGREVKSHSGFRVIFSANTQGRGANTVAESGYTAQLQALDISLLNRMVYFRFGYNKQAEKRILQEKIGNDRIVEQVIKFRDTIRDNIRQGVLSTPFSTRHLVTIGDLYRVLGSIDEAIYRAVFEAVLPDELAKYNEAAHLHFGVDLLAEFSDKAIFDYM